MGKKKILSYNKAINDAKKKIHEVCIDLSIETLDKDALLDALESLKRGEPASSSSVPEDPGPKGPH